MAEHPETNTPIDDAHATADRRDRVFETDHLQGDLKRRSVRGGVDTLAAQGVKFVVQLASIAILARLLADTDFGKFAKVMAVVGIASLFKDAGLSMATVQSKTVTHRQVSTLFWINVLISVVLALIGCALAPLLVWFYKDPDTLWITIALSLFIIFGGFTMQQQAILRRQMRFRTVAAIDVVSVVLGLAMAIAAALSGWGYWALVVQQGGHHVSAMIGMWVASRWVPSRPSRADGVGSMLRFGVFFAGSNVANYGASNVDKVVLGYNFTDAIVGQYRNAFGLLMMPVQQMFFPITNVAVSVLSRTVDDPARFRRAFLSVLDHIAIVTMPVLAIAIVCADWIVRVVLGAGWRTAGEIFFILGFASLLQPVTNATSWALISYGRTDSLFKTRIAFFFSVLVAVLIGARFGVEGVAVGYVIAVSTVRLPLQILLTARHTPVRGTRIVGSFLLYLVATLVALGAAWLVRAEISPITSIVGDSVRLPLLGYSGYTAPVLSIALTAPVLLATYTLVISLFPHGRNGIRSMLDIAQHVVRKRSIPKPA